MANLILDSRESKQSSKDNLQNREPTEWENVCAHHTFEDAARKPEGWGMEQRPLCSVSTFLSLSRKELETCKVRHLERF